MSRFDGRSRGFARRAWQRSLATVVVAMLAATALTTSAAATPAEPPRGPDGDAFYVPPNPLPPGAGGDVIWWREVSATPLSTTYLVLYHSESATGNPIAVSGRVMVPNRPWHGKGPRPIVSVAGGTRGIGDDCAPSKFQPDYERPLNEAMLAQGWAIAMTDYEGLGTPGGHTYVVGQSEGRAVLDATRAATRLPVAGLAAGGPVAFTGYSQGGGGAAWAGELAPDYAPELDVVGIAAGGVPADLPALRPLADGGLGFGLYMMAGFGFDTAYPELDLHSFLNEKGRALYEREQDACIDRAFLYAFQRMSQYTTSDPLADPRWQARMNENRLGANPPEVPIYLFHGVLDELVAYGQAKTLRKEYCAAGADVLWASLPGEHVVTMVQAAPTVVAYLAGRFAGRPAPTNC